jgi:ferredoxin
MLALTRRAAVTIATRARATAMPFVAATSSSSSSFSTRSATPPADDGPRVSFAFLESSTGNKVLVSGVVGKTVLDTAVAHDVDIEGACGGELACSTCHVVVPPDVYSRLPKKKEVRRRPCPLPNAFYMTPHITLLVSHRCRRRTTCWTWRSA